MKHKIVIKKEKKILNKRTYLVRTKTVESGGNCFEAVALIGFRFSPPAPPHVTECKVDKVERLGQFSFLLFKLFSHHRHIHID